MEDLVQTLTRGNVTEVKVVLASVTAKLGPTSAAEIELHQDRIEAAEERLEQREELAEERREN